MFCFQTGANPVIPNTGLPTGFGTMPLTVPVNVPITQPTIPVVNPGQCHTCNFRPDFYRQVLLLYSSFNLQVNWIDKSYFHGKIRKAALNTAVFPFQLCRFPMSNLWAYNKW